VEPQRGLRNWGYANYIYLVYALFPLVFLSEKKMFRYTATALLIVATIVSKKRTAVILLVAYAVVFSWRAFTRKKIRTYQFVLILVALVAIVALSYGTSVFENISSNYLYRFDTSNDDNWNGRFAIWSYGLARWWSGNILNIIFGNNITYSYSGSNVELTMHNDYLEMLTNYGIIGLIMIISFIVWLVKRTKSFEVHNYEEYNTVATFTCINYFILMVTSHIIIYPYLMALCLAPIAFCEGMERREGYENRAY
jgi:O-antigen ligase